MIEKEEIDKILEANVRIVSKKNSDYYQIFFSNLASKQRTTHILINTHLFLSSTNHLIKMRNIINERLIYPNEFFVQKSKYDEYLVFLDGLSFTHFTITEEENNQLYFSSFIDQSN